MILEPDFVTRFYLDAIRDWLREQTPAELTPPRVTAAAPAGLGSEEIGFFLFAMGEDRAAGVTAAERLTLNARTAGQRTRREAWNLDFLLAARSGRKPDEAPLAEQAMLAAAMRGLEYAQRIDRPRQRPVTAALANDPDVSISQELFRHDLPETLQAALRSGPYGLRPAIGYRVRAVVNWMERD